MLAFDDGWTGAAGPALRKSRLEVEYVAVREGRELGEAECLASKLA